jgi:hypothetical protein
LGLRVEVNQRLAVLVDDRPLGGEMGQQWNRPDGRWRE